VTPTQGGSNVKAPAHQVYRNRGKKGRARFRGATGFHKIQLIRGPHEISTYIYTFIIIYLAVSFTLTMPLIHKVHEQFKLTI